MAAEEISKRYARLIPVLSMYVLGFYSYMHSGLCRILGVQR